MVVVEVRRRSRLDWGVTVTVKFKLWHYVTICDTGLVNFFVYHSHSNNTNSCNYHTTNTSDEKPRMRPETQYRNLDDDEWPPLPAPHVNQVFFFTTSSDDEWGQASASQAHAYYNNAGEG